MIEIPNDSLPRWLQRLRPRTLQNQMLFLLSVVVLAQLLVSGAIFATFIAASSKAQIGKRALDLAHTVASMPVVHRALEQGDPHGEVQHLTRKIRTRTGAEFIVVADRNSVRLSHPNPQNIGKTFVGSDEIRALQGDAYISESRGTLGNSLRGFAPIRNGTGEVIGFVAVGYLQETITEIVAGYQREPATLSLMLLVITLLGASAIARYVKLQTLGLEPRQISSLYLEREAVLEAISAGIVAVDGKGEIRLINRAATKYLGLDEQTPLVGQRVDEVLAPGVFLELLLARTETPLGEVEYAGGELLCASVKIAYSPTNHGIVASFRPLQDLHRLQQQLRHSEEFSEMLRVQAHEYSNKLHMLAGLLQLEAYQEALELVSSETSGLQHLIGSVSSAVSNPALAAIIMAKFNRARELKVDLTLEPESSMHDIPEHIPVSRLTTIVANLLDNAIEAAVRNPHTSPRVKLTMTDLGHDLIFDVEDSGPGIDAKDYARIFNRGYSSKKKTYGAHQAHGVGLYLVQQQVEALHAELNIAPAELGGTLFTLIVPKREYPEKEHA
ncbi:MAG: ATP-binding protein [Thermodesulfobacteriota bacterium]